MKPPKFLPGDLVIHHNQYNTTISEIEYVYYIKSTQKWMMKIVGTQGICSEEDLEVYDPDSFMKEKETAIQED